MANVAILAHGKNWQLPIPPQPDEIRVSIESAMTAEAAGALLMSGVGDMIIFSGGHTAGPDYPSEASKMRETMYGYYGEFAIPSAAVVLEEQSYDTVTNLRATKEKMAELDIDELIYLTVGYHLPRVKYLAKALDIPVREAYKSERVLRTLRGHENHLYARRVLQQSRAERNLRPVVRAAASYALEGAGWGLALIDPKAEGVARLATTKLRHQAGAV